MEQSNTEIPTPPQPENIQSVSVPPPPQKSKSPMVLGIIVLLFVFVGVGIALGKFLFTQPTISVVEKLTPSAPTTQIMISPTTDLTSSWETYTNVTQGYELKYPADWNMKEKDCGLEANLDRTTCFESPDYIIDLAGFGTSKGGIISINGKHRNIGQEPSQLTTCLLSPTHPCSVERTKLNGYNILKILDNNSRGAIIGFIDKNIITLIIEVGYNPESKNKILDTFDQILSTFKFLDQDKTANTSNWKVYIFDNKVQSFQFKYPSEWKRYVDSGSVGYDDTGNGYYTIGVGFQINTNNLPLEDFVNTISSYNRTAVKIPVLVGSRKGIQINNQENGVYYSVIYCQYDDKAVLEIDASGNRNTNQELLTKILSTFKFLN